MPNVTSTIKMKIAMASRCAIALGLGIKKRLSVKVRITGDLLGMARFANGRENGRETTAFHPYNLYRFTRDIGWENFLPLLAREKTGLFYFLRASARVVWSRMAAVASRTLRMVRRMAQVFSSSQSVQR